MGLLYLLHWQAGSLPLVSSGKPFGGHNPIYSCSLFESGRWADHVLAADFFLLRRALVTSRVSHTLFSFQFLFIYLGLSCGMQDL